MTLPKAYDRKQAEEKWYPYWERHGFFHGTVNPGKEPYTIVIPPPNITGVLHMGHILNNTLQDVFIRYRRMMGYEACWIPGTDHAGIATQNVIEKALAKDGKTRHDLGREQFVKKVWEWREVYGGVIIRQLRKLGVSCDWQREKFTMDDTLSRAVREVFVSLYEQGLIYKGKYIVNWCPKDHTAISDDEVTYSEQHGKLYHIRYPIDDETESEGFIGSAVVATTRPETMLGDVALAVHPNDERYKHLVGRQATLPLANREIPIIADSFVDPSFGTGIIKVTPAHDPNDYHIGERHGLGRINIFDVSARLNDEVPPEYRGLDRFDARTRIVRDLTEQGLLVKVEDHSHSVGRCYRCDTVIEPYLSDQWFVRMKPLAEPALKVVMDGTIRFYPDRWVKVYEHWMGNIRDWCISRQLWWGHRIPVWYCSAEKAQPGCEKPLVSRTTPERCPTCGSTSLRQDEDVLDTWFSSWLWPFSVHDWPAHEETGKGEDLRYFYPTNTLVTAPDIIFFWVARMIMSGLRFGPSFTNDPRPERNIPFRDVYFTSIIRDDKGRKMSKSLGNSPEPLDLIEEYGADAVRFTLLYLSPLGQDVYYSKEKNEIGRNFANKIWNAGRFLLLNRETIGEIPGTPEGGQDHMDLADRWILSRFHSTVRETTRGLDRYDVNNMAKTIYEFFWHDYCDWYVEIIKSRLYGDEPPETKRSVIRRAIDIFDGALRILHPFMPFVTEELWQNLRQTAAGESIMKAPLPEPDPSCIDPVVESEMAFMQKVIDSVRNIRGEMGIPPGREISLVVRSSAPARADQMSRYAGYLRRLARVSSFEATQNGSRPRHAASAVVEGEEIFVPLEGIIDLEVERARLGKEITRVSGLLEGSAKKLASEGFVQRAPEEVVRKEQDKVDRLTKDLEKLRRNLEALQ